MENPFLNIFPPIPSPVTRENVIAYHWCVHISMSIRVASYCSVSYLIWNRWIGIDFRMLQFNNNSLILHPLSLTCYASVGFAFITRFKRAYSYYLRLGWSLYSFIFHCIHMRCCVLRNLTTHSNTFIDKLHAPNHLRRHFDGSQF